MRQVNTFVQLTPGELPTARVGRVDLAGLRIEAQIFRHGVQIRSAGRPGAQRIGIIAHSVAPVRQRGVAWAAREMAVVRDDLDLYTLGPSAFIWIEADRDIAAGVLGERATSSEILSPGSSSALETLRDLCVEAAGGGELAAAEQRERILRALGAACSADDRVVDRAAQERYAFVRHVEDFMWQHVEEPLDLTELARAMSCSPRNLQYLFKRIYGLGPMSYFKVQRLNAARQALAESTRSRSILDVAATHGFWHLGHFGTSYKALFGVTPSETRRREGARGYLA